MKRIKVICMTIVIAVLCLGVFVQGYADWQNAPNSNNYSDELKKLVKAMLNE